MTAIARRGFTLIEVMISLVILGLVALASMQSMSFISRQGVNNRDGAFASQKALQLLEEVRARAQTGTLEALDTLTDAAPNPLLTLHGVSDPGDPLSGNPDRRYLRRVDIHRVPGQNGARRAQVRILRAADGRLLAETVGLVRKTASQYAATQVYDLFILALENVMGSWTNLPELKPAVDLVLKDLETRNPGLEFRTHWIRRLSIGRDPHYRPFFNREKASNDLSAYPWAYIYPGTSRAVSGNRNVDYFDHRAVQSRHYVDAVSSGTLSMADRHNHALRLPDEIAAAAAAGLDPDEGTLRLLLENLHQTSRYQNVIFLNLHGETLPVPPLRNYSDPAKAPGDAGNARVVTHPERLRYDPNPSGRNDDPIRLRVYSYLATSDPVPDGEVLPRDVTLRIPGVTSGVTVRYLKRASPVTPARDYEWVTPDASEAEVTYPAGLNEARVRLFNTPLGHGQNNANQGLSNDARLFGWQYIPCDVGDGDPFSVDLSTPGSRPKNTARWVVEIPADRLSGRVDIETRIADNDAATDDFDLPSPRLSRTYVWVGDSDEDVPVTERFQYMGDPRHMPYIDVKLRDGYNWYFNGPPMTPGSGSATDYQGFPRYRQTATLEPTGWKTYLDDEKVALDVPRFNKLWRDALMRNNDVYVSMTGMPAAVMAAGGEFGADYRDGPFQNGISMPTSLWVPDGSVNTLSEVDERSNSSGGSQDFPRLVARRDGTWRSFPWLGELYPDGAHGDWMTSGNLPASGYYRDRQGAPFSFEPSVVTNGQGGSSFFGGSASGNVGRYFSSFQSVAHLSSGSVTSQGHAMASLFNFSLPATLKSDRPFALNYSNGNGWGQAPVEWALAPYNDRLLLDDIETYVGTQHSSAEASMLLMTVRPQTADGRAAHMVVSGLSQQSGVGPAPLARVNVMAGLRSFLRLTHESVPANHGRITPLPRVFLDAPEDGEETSAGVVSIEWSVEWNRWNGGPYTEAHTTPVTGNTAGLTFNVKYSSDTVSWHCVQAPHAAARWGVPTAACAVPAGQLTQSWDVSSLPAGLYHVVVEAYDGRRHHYAYHRTRVRIL